MENKEVVLVERKVGNALTESQKLVVKDDKTLVSGIDLLKRIKVLGKFVKQEKDRLLVPARAVVTGIREMFKPAETNFEEAEKITKAKIKEYTLKVEEENRIKEEKLAKRVEKGTMKEETAVKKMGDIKEAPTQGKTGRVVMKTRRVPKIVDAAKIPRKYLSINMVLIRKDAITNGIEIPGVIVVEEKELATY